MSFEVEFAPPPPPPRFNFGRTVAVAACAAAVCYLCDGHHYVFAFLMGYGGYICATA
jgi:hypothetical protein